MQETWCTSTGDRSRSLAWACLGRGRDRKPAERLRAVPRERQGGGGAPPESLSPGGPPLQAVLTEETAKLSEAAAPVARVGDCR